MDAPKLLTGVKLTLIQQTGNNYRLLAECKHPKDGTPLLIDLHIAGQILGPASEWHRRLEVAASASA